MQLLKILHIGFIAISINSIPLVTKADEAVKEFLSQYEETFQKLDYVESLANWRSDTLILPCDKSTGGIEKTVNCDETNSQLATAASAAVTHFTGSQEIVSRARQYLKNPTSLTAVQKNVLKTILYKAAQSPQKISEVVNKRIALSNKLNKQLFVFPYSIDGKEVSTNDIDRILRTSNNLAERLKAWKASKEVGKVLKEEFSTLRDLRNQVVREAGYRDYFAYEVSPYGMKTREMLDFLNQINKEIYPLYRELHTYVRYELASHYGEEEPPEFIPAHWLPNRWGQNWSSLIKVDGLNLDAEINKKFSREKLINLAENFYVSIGFSKLPKSFYRNSSLYPLPQESPVKKNNHATAWHLDLDKDVRSIMSVEPNTYWYQTTHHELGHIYNYLAYSNPEVPLLLRRGANRGFDEGIGTLMGLAAIQPSYLQTIGLDAPNTDEPEVMNQKLLKEALRYIVEIPWQIGVMTNFESELYSENLSPEKFNDRWWALKKQYQGIVPPESREGEWADALSKTHIINDPAQYYDYAIANLITFQFHTHICKKILKQNIYDANYMGNTEIGDFLFAIMHSGATKDWQVLLKKEVGKKLSAQPMLEYFSPLMDYLKMKNAGRKYTLPLL